MGKRRDLFMLSAGFVFFIFDVASDIYVAVQYFLEGEIWWFRLTLLFIILPLFIVSIMSTWQTIYCIAVDCLLMFLCLSILVRYVKQFTQWKRTFWDNSRCLESSKECNCADCQNYYKELREYYKTKYTLAWIRYVETTIESKAQCCLQVYIMLHQWDFPWYTVTSVVLSLLSLSWSITALERAKADKKGIDFKMDATVLLFFSEVLCLSCRLFVIAVFAYNFKQHVFTAIAVHLLTVNIVSYWVGFGCQPCKCDRVAIFLTNVVCCFPFMFHVPEIVVQGYKDPRTISFVMHILISVENVLLAILAFILPMRDHAAKHIDIIGRILLPFVAIVLIKDIIFLVLYFKHYLGVNKKPRKKPSEKEPDDSEKVAVALEQGTQEI